MLDPGRKWVYCRLACEETNELQNRNIVCNATNLVKQFFKGQNIKIEWCIDNEPCPCIIDVICCTPAIPNLASP